MGRSGRRRKVFADCHPRAPPNFIVFVTSPRTPAGSWCAQSHSTTQAANCVSVETSSRVASTTCATSTSSCPRVPRSSSASATPGAKTASTTSANHPTKQQQERSNLGVGHAALQKVPATSLETARSPLNAKAPPEVRRER